MTLTTWVLLVMLAVPVPRGEFTTWGGCMTAATLVMKKYPRGTPFRCMEVATG
jgi:hypothetical protein